MTGKSHQVLGLAASLTVFLVFTEPSYQPATLAFVVAGSSLAALIPDIDQPASKIWDLLPFGHLAGKVIDPFLEHRNLSHSLLGQLIFSLLIFKLLGTFPDYWGVNGRIVAICLSLSYFMHLIADFITSEGIPWFFPLQKMFGFPPRPFKFLRIHTGHLTENLLVFPLANLWLILLVVFDWDVVKVSLFK